jgi:hypothetical protein
MNVYPRVVSNITAHTYLSLSLSLSPFLLLFLVRRYEGRAVTEHIYHVRILIDIQVILAPSPSLQKKLSLSLR